MKKILSTLLALVLVLSLATVAFADTTEVTYGPTTNSKTFSEIVKYYKSENDVAVTETLSFTQETAKDEQGTQLNPDGGVAKLNLGTVSVEATAFSEASKQTNGTYKVGTLEITIPSGLTKPGEYEWIIKETKGTTPGVTYDTDKEIHVLAYVGYDNEAKTLKLIEATSYIKKIGNSGKVSDFTNEFKSGSFTVKKDVIGNMANENDKFVINVTLTSANKPGTTIKCAGTPVAPNAWTQKDNSWTYTHKLEISESSNEQTFSDIPVGVTVSTVVEETPGDGYTFVKTVIGDYTINATNLTVTTGNEFTSFNVDDTTVNKITIINKNEATIETGIALDSMPYFLMLAVACMGLVFFTMKKRATREY